MDQPVVLNEELPKQYESYSSSSGKNKNTLDEPIIDTIVLYFLTQKRDAMEIYLKIRTTFGGGE